MRAFKSEILPNVIAGLIVEIFVIIITSIYSHYTTGTLEYLLNISWYYYVILFLVIVLIISIFRNIKKSKKYTAYGSTQFPSNYIKIYSFLYDDVKWLIQVPEFSISKHSLSNKPIIDVNYVEVDTPPRCPNCETELLQKETFWGKYRWYCPTNDFNKKKKKSFYDNENIRKMAKRRIEKDNDENSKYITDIPYR